MNSRCQQILKALVEEYIERAEPISSGFLAEEYENWHISPATIRNELMELNEEGYIEQPYTSAGRVPTAKGYRFFVDNFLADVSLNAESQRMVDAKHAFDELGDFLAKESKSLVLGSEDSKDVREEGLRYLLDEPEFQEREFLIDFVRRAEEIRKGFKKFMDLADQNPHLYIGSEGEEIIGDTKYSFIVTRMDEKGFAIFFGSTRMNYEKGLALARYLCA